MAQAAMLDRASNVHDHAARSAKMGLYKSTRDHWSIGFRVPQEWGTLTKELKEAKSLSALKNGSKREFLGEYAAFQCALNNCGVCWGSDD